MPFYTKKPVTIEARQFLPDTAVSVADWCYGDLVNDDDAAQDDVPLYIAISTLEGVMEAKLGDYIIKGVNGEFYPCKPDIFDKTYEPFKRVTFGETVIRVDDMVDHEDGSCTIGFSMDAKSIRTFAEIGVKKVLIDECNRILSENDEFDTNVGC